MHLSSPAFEHNNIIPTQYTCDGPNVNPPLHISDVPDDAKSLVLIMDDPDIPDFVKTDLSIDVYDHWVLFNLAPDVSTIEEHTVPPGTHGVNSNGDNAYTGCCPPDKEHRYFFKLYALDTTLDVAEGATKQEIEAAMEGHIIEQTELIGRYNRPENTP